jgi:alpha-L-fucosidase
VVKNGAQASWYPAECDVSIRPGWFYHQREDGKVKSLATLADIYVKSAGRNSVLLLNIPPDRRGRIAEPDAARLKEFRTFLDQLYATDYVKAAPLTAFSHLDAAHGEAQLRDGDLTSYWMPAAGQTTGQVEFDLGQPRTFNVARIQENIALGERVQA